MNLKGKKLLILGGVFQHCKLVEAAKRLGVITYVTDYLPPEVAPAKQIADHYFMHNITDIDAIVKTCREEKIDGVISTSLDACQRPYQLLCEKLGLPCFGSEEQFNVLTDKISFKKFCNETGVDTIPEYMPDDFENKETCDSKVEFPILIKPCDSRGSRGQTICYSYDDAKAAIPFAQSESLTGRIVIEKYMGQKNDFSMTILIINKKVYVTRTVDRILGRYEDGLDKLAVGSVSPSKFTDTYIKNVHPKIEKFVEKLGLVNAPLFMQGFVDGDTIRFYDPGLRLPGGEHERFFEQATGKNPLFPLIEYALTGTVSEESVKLSDKDVLLNGKVVGQTLPALKAGTITKIEGMDKIKSHPDVIAVFERFKVGDVISETHNVNQRFCEIDVMSNSNEELSTVVEFINSTLKIYNEQGEDMIISKYNPALVLNNKN